MNPNCLNCETAIQGGQHFCPQCGQKADTHRISLHEITHDAVHYFTHADKGIFHLLKELVKKPGKVAREYIAGKRKTYFKPLNFFLIVAGIVVFMTSTFYFENSRPQQRRPNQTVSAKPPSAEQIQQWKEMGKRGQTVNKISGKYSNIITMLATPLFAALFWLCYRRNQYSYLEHLVANLYFVGMIMLFYALIITPLRTLNTSGDYLMTLLMIFFAVEIIYRGFAYYQFMGKKGKIHLLKALGVSMLASGIWISFTWGLIMYYIRYGF